MRKAAYRFMMENFPGGYKEALSLAEEEAEAFFGDEEYDLDMSARDSEGKVAIYVVATLREKPLTGGRVIFPNTTQPGSYVPPF